MTGTKQNKTTLKTNKNHSKPIANNTADILRIVQATALRNTMHEVKARFLKYTVSVRPTEQRTQMHNSIKGHKFIYRAKSPGRIRITSQAKVGTQGRLGT